MPEPKILYPWSIRHASGVRYTVLADLGHQSAIEAATAIERYKFDGGDLEQRTFHPSPIVQLERGVPVYLVEMSE